MFVHTTILFNCLQNAAIMKKKIWLFFKDISIKTHVAFFVHPSANKTTQLKTIDCFNHLKNYQMNTT
jgi:hypothetical protein